MLHEIFPKKFYDLNRALAIPQNREANPTPPGSDQGLKDV
jgi:hypothetical protein